MAFCSSLRYGEARRRIHLFHVRVLNTSDPDGYPEASVSSPLKYVETESSCTLTRKLDREI